MSFETFIDNRTPLRVRCAPLDDHTGRDVAVLIAKLSYEVSEAGLVRLAFPQAPVRVADEPVSFGDERSAYSRSVRYPSDWVADKPGTDVLLVGTAHPPPGAEGTHDVSLRVARDNDLLIDRTVRVRGPSVWYNAVIGLAPSPPGRLAPTSLIYELAYGGTDASGSTEMLVDWRNPVGRGVARDRKSLIHMPAPLLEDPAAPLASPKPAPAGFGPIATSWEPRSKHFGTYDTAWRRERAPLPPRDFNPRANCCAPEGQWLSTPLVGDEAIEVRGATPGGVLRFRLPRYAPELAYFICGERHVCETHLDTLLLDTDALRVELTWRGRIPIPKRTNTLERAEVRGALPEDLLDELIARAQAARRAREETGE